MKKRSLLVCILLMLLFIGCKSKDKEVVISNNVSKEVNSQDKAINENIELGNGYLKRDKYNDARKAYEKAISKDKLNKQNYIQIEEKYMDKLRFDDAYYFVKLAIDNKVDVDNMKRILEEIKKNFQMINIENSIYRKESYKLPDKVTVKVNGEDVQGEVIWDTADINTKNIGTVTYQGKIEKYGRTVQLKLNVKQTTFNNGGKYVSYKGKVYYRQGSKDDYYSEWITGDFHWKKDDYYPENSFVEVGDSTNIMCLDEDGKSKVIFRGKGQGNIYIYNDKMYLEERDGCPDKIYVVNLDGSNMHEIAKGFIKGIDEETGTIVYVGYDETNKQNKLYKINAVTNKTEEYSLSIPYYSFAKLSNGIIYYTGSTSSEEWEKGEVKLCSVDVNGENSKLLADIYADLKDIGGYVSLEWLQVVDDTIYFSYGGRDERYYLGGQIAKVSKDGSDFEVLVGNNIGIADKKAFRAMDEFYVENNNGSKKLYYTSAIDKNVNYALNLNTREVSQSDFVVGEEGIPFESNNGIMIYSDSSAQKKTLIPNLDYSILNTDKKVDLNTIDTIQICSDWVYFTLNANERCKKYDGFDLVGYNRFKSVVLRKQINGDKVEKLFEY